MLQISKKNVVESEFDERFMRRLLPKLEWSVIYGAAQVVSRLSCVIPPEGNFIIIYDNF